MVSMEIKNNGYIAYITNDIIYLPISMVVAVFIIGFIVKRYLKRKMKHETNLKNSTLEDNRNHQY